MRSSGPIGAEEDGCDGVGDIVERMVPEAGKRTDDDHIMIRELGESLPD